MNEYFKNYLSVSEYLESIGFMGISHSEFVSYYTKTYNGFMYELILERDYALDHVKTIYMKMFKFEKIDYINKDNVYNDKILDLYIDINKYDFDEVLRDSMLKHFKNDIRKTKIKRILNKQSNKGRK